jgi:hypothetical protein
MTGETGNLESIRSLTHAVALMIDGSGICRKVMADRLGIEARHLSRMLNGEDSRHFPPDMIDKAMDICGSTLPLEYQAWRRGYAIHSHSVVGVLEAIRDAMVRIGEAPKFVIHANDRVEAADFTEVNHGKP